MEKLILGLKISFKKEEHGYYSVILFDIWCFTQYDMVWFHFQITIKAINVQIGFL
jgi:hypothetical protein